MLAAANELFYEEGICSVGVDRIQGRADVARASLYSGYGSKDELVRAYLQARSDGWQAFVAQELPGKWPDARDRTVGIFELMTEWFAAPGYRACPFINASAEEDASKAVEEVRDRHRAWVRSMFTGLAREAGAKKPAALSEQLVLIYDGSMVGAQLDHSAAPGVAAQMAAAALLDAALSAARR